MNQSIMHAQAKYPFLNLAIVKMPQIFNNIRQYDSNSCRTISNICRAGMVTVDSMRSSDNSLNQVPVMRMLGDLWQMFWNGNVAFAQAALTSAGTRQIIATAMCLTTLGQFETWDDTLQPCPFPDVGGAMYNILNGVTP